MAKLFMFDQQRICSLVENVRVNQGSDPRFVDIEFPEGKEYDANLVTMHLFVSYVAFKGRKFRGKVNETSISEALEISIAQHDKQFTRK